MSRFFVFFESYPLLAGGRHGGGCHDVHYHTTTMIAFAESRNVGVSSFLGGVASFPLSMTSHVRLAQKLGERSNDWMNEKSAANHAHVSMMRRD